MQPLFPIPRLSQSLLIFLLASLCASCIGGSSDTNLPIVTVSTPEAPLSGNVTVEFTARARDGKRVTASVSFQSNNSSGNATLASKNMRSDWDRRGMGNKGCMARPQH